MCFLCCKMDLKKTTSLSVFFSFGIIVMSFSSAPTYSVRSSPDMSAPVHTAWCVNRSKDLSSCLSFYINLILKMSPFYQHFFRIPTWFYYYVFFLSRGTAKSGNFHKDFCKMNQISAEINAQTTAAPPKQQNGAFLGHFKNLKHLYASLEFIGSINYVGKKLFY